MLLPAAGAILATGGLLLFWRKNPWAPYVMITGGLLSTVPVVGQVLEHEQLRGRLQ